MALNGMDVLRPPPVPPATAPVTDIELFTGVGGAQMLARMAGLCGRSHPVIIMAGDGSHGTAMDAAEDLGELLAAARAYAPTDGRMFPTVAPVDMRAAESLLRVIVRLAEKAKDGTPAAGAPAAPGAAAPAAASSTTPAKRDLGTRELKVVPEKAAPERVLRACGAALLNPICTDEQARKAALYAALADPMQECRRLLMQHPEHVDALRGYLLSSGEVDVALAGEMAGPFVAARTGIAAFISQHMEREATPSRAREAAATIQSGTTMIQTLDVTSTPIIQHYGGIQPSATVWRTERAYQPSVLGRWGTVSGPTAMADAERAMRNFAPLYIALCHEINGCPAPVDPTYGLVPLIQSTACLEDAARISLLDEAFERISQDQQRSRRQAGAKKADPEATFMLAMQAVKPISDHAASQEAGRQAGEAAARAMFQQLSPGQKRPLPATSGGDQPDAGTGTPKLTNAQKRRERDAKRAQARADAAAAAGTSSQLVPAAGATAANPLQLTGPGAKTGPPPVAGAKAGGLKLEPLQLAEVKPASISRLMLKDGTGLVEIVDRLHQTLMPTAGQHELPCGWMAAAGECKPRDGQPCRKCAKQIAPDPRVMAAVKAGCKPELLTFMTTKYPQSPLLK